MRDRPDRDEQAGRRQAGRSDLSPGGIAAGQEIPSHLEDRIDATEVGMERDEIDDVLHPAAGERDELLQPPKGSACLRAHVTRRFDRARLIEGALA